MKCPKCGFDVTNDSKAKAYVTNKQIMCRNCGYIKMRSKPVKKVISSVEPKGSKSSDNQDFI